jgi:hypothetical protein
MVMEEKRNTVANRTSLEEQRNIFNQSCKYNLEVADYRCAEIRAIIAQAKELLKDIHKQSNQLDYLIGKYHINPEYV